MPGTTVFPRTGRLWVVGSRTDTLIEGDFFAMPEPLPPQLGLSLADILSPPRAGDDPRALPRAPGAALNVSRARLKAEEREILGDSAFTQGLSDK